MPEPEQYGTEWIKDNSNDENDDDDDDDDDPRSEAAQLDVFWLFVGLLSGTIAGAPLVGVDVSASGWLREPRPPRQMRIPGGEVCSEGQGWT